MSFTDILCTAVVDRGGISVIFGKFDQLDYVEGSFHLHPYAKKNDSEPSAVGRFVSRFPIPRNVSDIISSTLLIFRKYRVVYSTFLFQLPFHSEPLPPRHPTVVFIVRLYVLI